MPVRVNVNKAWSSNQIPELSFDRENSTIHSSDQTIFGSITNIYKPEHDEDMLAESLHYLKAEREEESKCYQKIQNYICTCTLCNVQPAS